MNGGRIARAVLGLTLGASCCLAGAVGPPDGDGRGDGAARRERSGRRLAPRGARPGKRSPASRKRPRRRAGLDRETARIVEEGLAYLACTQRPDGSWRDRVGRKVYTSYRGREAPHVGVTALAGIAFLSSGVVPGGGPGKYVDRDGNLVYGHQVVEKAVDYVLASTSATGFIHAHGSRMYSHAFGALFLAEAYGTGYSRGGQLKRGLKRSIDMIVNVQNEEGGWRYRPQATDSDMSITVCQVMALRAGRNAGIDVPKETIDSAVRYVRRSFLPGLGAFTYQLGPEYRGARSRYSFALTAAGVTTLYGAGEYSANAVIHQALRYLKLNRPPYTKARYYFDYYYGQYYAVQAFFQKGDEDFASWYEDYIKPSLVQLRERVRIDGRELSRWTDLVGSNYATAMATIILQFPNQYLPITEN
ncbi:MAG: terpene cyclase/mutase family protein [Planctomycetota bacterium]|nr:terpene cyclase/mutase family protein [Planctomycetota bacterium]